MEIKYSYIKVAISSASIHDSCLYDICRQRVVYTMSFLDLFHQQSRPVTHRFVRDTTTEQFDEGVLAVQLLQVIWEVQRAAARQCVKETPPPQHVPASDQLVSVSCCVKSAITCEYKQLVYKSISTRRVSSKGTDRYVV